ncbi:MAG: hypothetical protein M1835_001041 [Candelina submexicana]|nr:MAG: hypothetical protein M1835_001041 [Candelina submexicana]
MKILYYIYAIVITASAAPADEGSSSGQRSPCDSFFGHPTHAHCANAIELIGGDIEEPGSEDANTLRYIYAPPGPQRAGIYNQDVPIVAAGGDCVVIVAFDADFIANHPQNEWWDLATWEDLRRAGREINDRCVGAPGILSGGKTTAGHYSKLSLQLLGPNSKIDWNYQTILSTMQADQKAEHQRVQSSIPQGIKETATEFRARVCDSMADCHGQYVDDCVKFSSVTMALVQYGVSTLGSLSVCAYF